MELSVDVKLSLMSKFEATTDNIKSFKNKLKTYFSLGYRNIWLNKKKKEKRKEGV